MNKIKNEEPSNKINWSIFDTPNFEENSYKYDKILLVSIKLKFEIIATNGRIDTIPSVSKIAVIKIKIKT